ncbi:MAG: hypothetical protein AAF799_06095 [Myxococcota bacterium]
MTWSRLTAIASLLLACTPEANESGSGADTAAGETGMTTTTAAPLTDSSGSVDETDEGTTEAGTETSADESTSGDPPSGQLELDTIIDVNSVVSTKGMDVGAGGEIFLWNYNQDDLERYADGMLETVANPSISTSFGTDLSLDDAGGVVVSQGGNTSGERLLKWDGATGEPLWGEDGVTIPDALLLGLTHAVVDGEQSLYACNGAPGNGQVLRIEPGSGTVVGSIDVHEVPLDVAVDASGNHYVLTSIVSNPLNSGDPVNLRKYDARGTQVAGPVSLTAAIYLTLAADGALYVTLSDFDAPTRAIASFDTDLQALSVTELPPEYVGFAGGITSVGSGDDLRIMITGQEGVGSDPICDVLVYRPV